MKLGFITDWGYVGAMLARSDDNEQTQFFKAFIKECQSWGTEYQVETQLAFINGKLTDKEKYLLGMLSYQDGEK